jgi:hypothetical protein
MTIALADSLTSTIESRQHAVEIAIEDSEAAAQAYLQGEDATPTNGRET